MSQLWYLGIDSTKIHFLALTESITVTRTNKLIGYRMLFALFIPLP